MKISQVIEHGASVSKGLVAVIKLSALTEDSRLPEILHEIEKWCLFFDLHMETLNSMQDASGEVPFYLLASLRDAVQKTQHLRHEAIRATLNEIVFSIAQKKNAISDQNAAHIVPAKISRC